MSFDFQTYARVLNDKFAQLTAADTVNAAKRFVRVDTGNLRNSITFDSPQRGDYEVFTEEVYAMAQEFGRPDLPNYGFTPYMRPGLQEALSKAEQNADQASKIARRRAES
jgi:hypothetical protein